MRKKGEVEGGRRGKDRVTARTRAASVGIEGEEVREMNVVLNRRKSSKGKSWLGKREAAAFTMVENFLQVCLWIGWRATWHEREQ